MFRFAGSSFPKVWASVLQQRRFGPGSLGILLKPLVPGLHLRIRLAEAQASALLTSSPGGCRPQTQLERCSPPDPHPGRFLSIPAPRPCPGLLVPLQSLIKTDPSSCSVASVFVTPCTIAHQAPLSMGFFRQEYWSGLPCWIKSKINSLPASFERAGDLGSQGLHLPSCKTGE